MGDLKFHHFIVPIAAAMAVIGLVMVAEPRRFGISEVLGPDLTLGIGNALIVFGGFCIASYGVVRAVEWIDRSKSKDKGHE